MIAENGNVLAEIKRSENGIIYSEIDVQRLADERRRMSTYPAVSTCSHTRINFSVKEEETVLTRKYPQYPFVPSVKEERDERCEEILNIQAMGLKKRMEHIHSKSAVVGLSGGWIPHWHSLLWHVLLTAWECKESRSTALPCHVSEPQTEHIRMPAN